MCFIKSVYRSSACLKHHTESFSNSKDQIPQSFKLKLNDIHQSNINSKQKTEQSQYLNFLFSLLSNRLSKNTESINKINQEIQQCEEKLENFFDNLKQSDYQLEKEPKLYRQYHSETFISQPQSPIKQEFSQNTLTNKIFGQKLYKYKLSLDGEFDEVIYKERNIKLNLNLKNLNGKVVKNSNVLNLCFALADDNGNWISQNRVGDPMLKGKTQVQLYHGQAEFNKIYTKDISRTFPNGHLNIVVYAKPSILIYDGLTSEYEEHVDQNSVEPLILNNIVIKAKKKY